MLKNLIKLAVVLLVIFLFPVNKIYAQSSSNISLFIANWGLVNVNNQDYDLDSNGFINSIDFAILTTPTVPTPTPTSTETSPTPVGSSPTPSGPTPTPGGNVGNLSTKPGDVYKNFSRSMGQTINGISANWHVTGYDFSASSARPNFCAELISDRSLLINDLSQAKRAEFMISMWGGHEGTRGKGVCFNNTNNCEDNLKSCATGEDVPETCKVNAGQCESKLRNKPEWLDIPWPDFGNLGGSKENYLYNFNPVINIPLNQLEEGVNTFMGISCCDNWPQWGMSGVMYRIFYEHSKEHPDGQIISHQNGDDLIENSSNEIEIVVNAYSSVGVKEVEVLAYYEGYDENGDGRFRDWHRSYFPTQQRKIAGHESELWEMTISEHAGTSNAPNTSGNYLVKWNTEWVPDQAVGSVKLLARIQDNNDVWFVSNPVENLSLARSGRSVKQYKTNDYKENFGVRNGSSISCHVQINSLTNANRAMVHLTTWNGQDKMHKCNFKDPCIGPDPIKINNWSSLVGGYNHDYAYSRLEIPVNDLKEGQNEIIFHSITTKHKMEILLPGPSILVEYKL